MRLPISLGKGEEVTGRTTQPGGSVTSLALLHAGRKNKKKRVPAWTQARQAERHERVTGSCCEVVTRLWLGCILAGA